MCLHPFVMVLPLRNRSMPSHAAEGAGCPSSSTNWTPFRRDVAECLSSKPAEIQTEVTKIKSSRHWARIERLWWLVLIVTMLVFSAFPIANLCLGLSTKDYDLWYQVGLAVRQGMDIYPRPETGRLFPFMYPPSAAAMLGFLSRLGQIGSLLALVFINSVSWFACIALSVWLAAGTKQRRHPLVIMVPTLSVVVLIYDIYLLGQPNLMLLALLLGAFACLRQGRQVGAGILVATAAAIKAFPILVLPYLVYRRMWTTVATTVATLAAWFVIAPLPFRSPDQVVDDLVVWSRGMIFTYNSYGIAQRPFRSYSYKNQSIMALVHRLFRDIPADGEAVLSQTALALRGKVRPEKRSPLVDPSTDLITFLRTHPLGSNSPARSVLEPAARRGRLATTDETPKPAVADIDAGISERGLPWDDLTQETQAALRSSWRINVLSLNFQTATLITVIAMLTLCVFVAAVLPPARCRNSETDALEFALVTLLTTMFSPLSFNYAYVWLLYPTTVALHRVLNEPTDARRHWLKVAWIGGVLLIPALAIPSPQVAQACGNLFVPALLLVLSLGTSLHAVSKHLRNRSEHSSTQSVHGGFPPLPSSSVAPSV
jgi:hypothetical protein